MVRGPQSENRGGEKPRKKSKRVIHLAVTVVISSLGSGITEALYFSFMLFCIDFFSPGDKVLPLSSEEAALESF